MDTRGESASRLGSGSGSDGPARHSLRPTAGRPLGAALPSARGGSAGTDGGADALRALPVGGPGGDWSVGGLSRRRGGSSRSSPAIPSGDVQPAASSAILQRVGVEFLAGRPGAARVSARREGGSTSWRISRRTSIGQAEAGDAQVAAYCPRRRPGSGPDGCAWCSPPSSSSPTSWSMRGSSA